MQELGPPDSHHLDAALGWLGLGLPAEAEAELRKIAPPHQLHPDVLEVHWAICAERQTWDTALLVARRLVAKAPDRASGWLNQAYALRRVPGGGLEKAWAVLKPAAEKFPEEPTIRYNLACYACQMERLAEARQWFQRALEVGDRRELKKMALADEDLRPLWPEIANANA